MAGTVYSIQSAFARLAIREIDELGLFFGLAIHFANRMDFLRVVEKPVFHTM